MAEPVEATSVRQMSRQEIQEKLKLKNNEYFRKAYLLPALKAGFIEMTVPDKPNSRMQKYRVTTAGKNARRVAEEE